MIKEYILKGYLETISTAISFCHVKRYKNIDIHIPYQLFVYLLKLCPIYYQLLYIVNIIELYVTIIHVKGFASYTKTGLIQHFLYKKMHVLS